MASALVAFNRIKDQSSCATFTPNRKSIFGEPKLTGSGESQHKMSIFIKTFA
jgi:hypothetical protein